MDISSLQHVNIKVAVAGGDQFDLETIIPVFHRWIKDKVLADELTIDVADYRHVPGGPGVILVAHEAIYGMDERDGFLGLLYDRRTSVEGTPQERLMQAAKAAFNACRLLEEDPLLSGRLSFDGGMLQVSINDRAIAPNDASTDQALRPLVEWLLESIWGSGEYVIERVGEPRELYRLSARASRTISVADVLSHL